MKDFTLETWTNSIGMEFVLIPGGTFWIGSADDDEDASDSEKPCHEVIISRQFYLGKYPVTQAQWKTVMGNNPSRCEGEKCPVETVSWNDVQEFIRKLNKMEGHGRYRLPTEAEWEYVCRAGSTTAYCFGNDRDKLGDYAWYGDNSRHWKNGEYGTHPVGKKKPNAWGLYDMHGNVWEWVQDWYGEYRDGSVKDPQGPSAGESRVLRGGSWFNHAKCCRSVSRGGRSPDSRCDDYGFRLALFPEY